MSNDDETKNGAAALEWHARPFTRVRGNFKGHYDYEVGPHTLIVGPNQSGKSGIVIGGRYGLGGVKGWSLGVHGSEIAALAPSGVDTLFHEWIGPDGTALFKVVQEGGKWREPEKEPIFTGELATRLTAEHRKKIMPLVSMSQLLELGPDLGRRELMMRFGDATKVPELIKPEPEQKALWDEVKKSETKRLTKKDEQLGKEIVPDASQILVAMSKEFNRRKLDAGKRVKALEDQLAANKAALSEQAAGSELLPGLREQLEKAKLWEAAEPLRLRKERLEVERQKYRAAREPFAAADTDEARARRAADEESRRLGFKKAIEEASAQVAAIAADLESQLKKLAWGQNLIEALERSERACVLCKTEYIVTTGHPDPVPFDRGQILEFVRPGVQAREQSVKTARANLAEAQQKVLKAQGDLQAFEQQLVDAKRVDDQLRQRLVQDHGRIKAAEVEIDNALATMKAPASYSGKKAADIAAEISALEEADAARRKLELDTEEIRKVKKTRDLAKEMEGESKQMLDRLIARVKSTAESACNKYMADGMRLEVDLEENRWTVVDPNGVPRSRHTMCGFEQDSAVIALAAGYTEGSPMRILLLDDPDIDGVGLENVPRFFGALQRAVTNEWLTQIIVAGNRLEPMLDVLKAMGWTIIQTGPVWNGMLEQPLHNPNSQGAAPIVPVTAPAPAPALAPMPVSLPDLDLFDPSGLPKL